MFHAMDQTADQKTVREPDQFGAGSKFCPDCSSSMPVSASFCPGCGGAMPSSPISDRRVGAFQEGLAGASAYFSFIPALFFLFREPYRSNRFVRFHAVQCLLLWVAGVPLAIIMRLLGLLVLLVPVIGPLLLVVGGTLFVLAAFLLWLVLIVKALQGQIFKLPWIGDFVQQFADLHSKE